MEEEEEILRPSRSRRRSALPNLHSGGWNPEFLTRRDLRGIAAIENQTWIGWKSRALSNGDDESGFSNPEIESDGPVCAEDAVSKSLIRDFMEDPEESDVCQPRADKVDDFCCGVTLGSLINGDHIPLSPHPLVAWLDERSSDAKLPYNPSFHTARGLYYALKKPVSFPNFAGTESGS